MKTYKLEQILKMAKRKKNIGKTYKVQDDFVLSREGMRLHYISIHRNGNIFGQESLVMEGDIASTDYVPYMSAEIMFKEMTIEDIEFAMTIPTECKEHNNG